MSNFEIVRDALQSLLRVTPSEEGCRVVTHCLYPSNSSVIVLVQGGPNGFVVSDEGRALADAKSYGLKIGFIEGQFKRLVRKQGLRVENGAIFSPPVPLDALGPAVMLVANASKEVAHWCLQNYGFVVKRNFKADLADLLNRYFKESLRHKVIVMGASSKLHSFDHEIAQPGGKRILIDAVLRDPSSIGTRVVANLDVQRLNNPFYDQRIVYDDSESWPSSDLELLKLGAPIVSFSRAADVLGRLRVS